MAGGSFTSQNKVRPGVYIRFKTAAAQTPTVGERGVVAICEPLSWGPMAQVMTIEAGANLTQFTGYDITHSKNRFLTEIFKGSNRTNPPKTVLLYRPTATGAEKAAATSGALTATAKYPGVRGNDISISVTAVVDETDAFLVSTVVDAEVVDQQTAETVDALTSNDWVDFSGTGALTAATGTALTGGSDGKVETAAYSAFLTNLEPYKFDILIYDGTDTTVQTAMVNFVKRLAEENGQYSQLVAAGLSNADSRFVINVESGVTLSDGAALSKQQTTWWVGGAQAGALYNQSLTYAAYPGAVAVSPAMTNSQYIAALEAGNFVLFAENGQVKVEQDINTLVTYTPDIGKLYRKNRIMRLCNTAANDIYNLFSANYIGIVDNTEAGRSQFKAAVVGYLLDLEGNSAIQNFSPDDVEVLAGSDTDAIVVQVAIQAVDSTEKVYLTFEIG